MSQNTCRFMMHERSSRCWVVRGSDVGEGDCSTRSTRSISSSVNYWKANDDTRWATALCMRANLLTTCFPLSLLSLRLPNVTRHIALGVIVLVALILGLVNGPGVWPRSVSAA